jgi:outer membrane protein
MTMILNYEDHIDYRVMLSSQTMDYMALRRQQSFYLPSLTASYTYQQMAMRDEFNFTSMSRPWYPSSFLAVSLNIPIFSSGLRSARVQEAKLELHKVGAGNPQVSQSLKLADFPKPEARFRNAREQYESERENLQLARKILRQTTIMHREGMATSLS